MKIALSWPRDVMLAVLKSMRMSGATRLVPCAAMVDWTLEKVVDTFTPRDTPLEMPVETSVP